jgi:plastocyanin
VAPRALSVLAASLSFTLGAAAAPATHTVTIDGFEFRPAVVKVSAGDVVVFRNNDLVPHTATAKDSGLDSGEIVTNGSFRYTIRNKGRVAYICSLHPTMKGEIVVE